MLLALVIGTRLAIQGNDERNKTDSSLTPKALAISAKRKRKKERSFQYLFLFLPKKYSFGIYFPFLGRIVSICLHFIDKKNNIIFLLGFYFSFSSWILFIVLILLEFIFPFWFGLFNLCALYTLESLFLYIRTSHICIGFQKNSFPLRFLFFLYELDCIYSTSLSFSCSYTLESLFFYIRTSHILYRYFFPLNYMRRH